MEKCVLASFFEMINFMLHHAKCVSKEIHTFVAVNQQF